MLTRYTYSYTLQLYLSAPFTYCRINTETSSRKEGCNIRKTYTGLKYQHLARYCTL
jgi:hypothetical protein